MLPRVLSIVALLGILVSLAGWWIIEQSPPWLLVAQSASKVVSGTDPFPGGPGHAADTTLGAGRPTWPSVASAAGSPLSATWAEGPTLDTFGNGPILSRGDHARLMDGGSTIHVFLTRLKTSGG